MLFSEFRRRFDVLAPHLTKKHGRNYIVVDERRVGLGPRALPDPLSSAQTPLRCNPFFPRGSQAGPCSAPGFGHPRSGQGCVATSCGSGGKTARGMGCKNLRRTTLSGEARGGGACSLENQTILQEPRRWRIRTDVLLCYW